MLVGFRQGLVRAPANFLMKNGTAVSLQVPPSDTVIVTIADGNSNYLISEKHTIVNAWTGPYASNTNYWLYWDIHLVTGKRTFGHTLMEPLKGPTPPANAKDGQHWFDTTSNQMKVYIHAVKRWQRVIRVFAAKLAQGGVFVSMSRQSPSFVGTQVGLNIPTSSGALIYDNLGGVLKKKDGTYFTTEDYALTGIAYSSQVKYASVQIRAEADAYMPPLTLVRFTDFNVVRPASNHVVDKVTYGIIETKANVGDIVNVTMDGVIRSAMWDWTSAGINAPIFVDGYGALTNVPSIPPIPVAVVVDKDAILLRPSSLFFGDNGSGKVSLAASLGDLTNVAADVDSAAAGQIMYFNGSQWVNGTTGSTSGVQAYSSSLDVLAAKTTTGLLVQTGDHTYASVEVAGTDGCVNVTNGSGVNGNPTIDLAASGVEAGSYNLVTVDTYGRVTAGANVTAITTSIATNSLPVRSAVYVDGAGVVQLAKADASATVKAVGFIAAEGAIATTGSYRDWETDRKSVV